MVYRIVSRWTLSSIAFSIAGRFIMLPIKFPYQHYVVVSCLQPADFIDG